MSYPLALRQDAPLISPNLQEGAIIYRERIISVPNAAGQTAKVQTITPGVGTQEITVYRLIETLTGQTITVTSDATPTAQEVCDLIRTAIRNNVVLNSMVTVSGTTTVVITGRNAAAGTNWANFNFQENGSTPTNVLTVANTTAAADSANIPVGRGVVSGTDGKIKLSSGALSAGSNEFRGVIGLDFTDFYGVGFAAQVPGIQYPGNHPMSLLKKGEICVRFLTAMTPLSSIFMVHSGTDSGRFASSNVANSTQISAGIRCVGNYAAGALGVLEVNLPA